MRTSRFFLAALLVLVFGALLVDSKYTEGSTDNHSVNEDSIQMGVTSVEGVPSPMTGISYIPVVWGAFSTGSF